MSQPRILPYRSRLEAKYAAALELRRLCGEIKSWEYEPQTFKLAPRTTYTPDFRVVTLGDSVEYHEVKGWHRNLSTSRVKWKLAAQCWTMYVWRWVTWRKKTWHIETYKPAI